MGQAVQLHRSQKSLWNTVMLGKAILIQKQKKKILLSRLKQGIINTRLRKMKGRGNSHSLLQVTFQVVLTEMVGISAHSRTPPGKEPHLTLKLALLGEEG